jgi:hypothetical protein
MGGLGSSPEHMHDSVLVERRRRLLLGGAYTLLSDGELQPAHAEHPHATGAWGRAELLTSPLGPMHSAYMLGEGTEPELTSRDVYYQSTLDYIWLGYAQRKGGRGAREDNQAFVLELLEMPCVSANSLAQTPEPPNLHRPDRFCRTLRLANAAMLSLLVPNSSELYTMHTQIQADRRRQTCPIWPHPGWGFLGVRSPRNRCSCRIVMADGKERGAETRQTLLCSTISKTGTLR